MIFKQICNGGFWHGIQIIRHTIDNDATAATGLPRLEEDLGSCSVF